MKQQTICGFAIAAVALALCVTSTPVQATDTDAKIASSFKQTYVYRTYLNDDAITAVAKDGVVTLAGTVAQASHKTLAQETALRLPGVTRVDNQLTVPAGGVVENSDAWVANQVKLALQFHRTVNATATFIKVKDGIVTLTGEALSATQKGLAAEYAADIGGVRGVRNEMTVATAPQTAERPGANLQPVDRPDGNLDDASISCLLYTSPSPRD